MNNEIKSKGGASVEIYGVPVDVKVDLPQHYIEIEGSLDKRNESLQFNRIY